MAEQTKGGSEHKSLEMRVAELEDRLSKMHITEDEMKTYHKVASLVGAHAPGPQPFTCIASQCVTHACVTHPCAIQQCGIRPCTIVNHCIQPCVIRQCINHCINECGGGCLPGGGGVGGGGFGGLGS
jgi:hypothetical protein